MKVKVYIDLDDTLADTSKYIEKTYNYKGYNINHSLLKKNIKLYKDYFIWNKIKKEENFWINLPKTEIADDIYLKALELSENIKDVYILTALPKLFFKKNTIEFENAKNKKIEWVKKNFKNILEENILVVHAKDKKDYVSKDSKDILFDDKRKNINEWKKAGGIAYLVKTNKYELI